MIYIYQVQIQVLIIEYWEMQPEKWDRFIALVILMVKVEIELVGMVIMLVMFIPLIHGSFEE